MPAKRAPKPPADALASTDRVAQIDDQVAVVTEAIRAALLNADAAGVASLNRQLSQLGRERAERAEPAEVSPVDDLAARRRNRKSGADSAGAATGSGKRAR